MDIFSCWIGEQEKEIRNIKPTTTVKEVLIALLKEHLHTLLNIDDDEMKRSIPSLTRQLLPEFAIYTDCIEVDNCKYVMKLPTMYVYKMKMKPSTDILQTNHSEEVNITRAILQQAERIAEQNMILKQIDREIISNQTACLHSNDIICADELQMISDSIHDLRRSIDQAESRVYLLASQINAKVNSINAQRQRQTSTESDNPFDLQKRHLPTSGRITPLPQIQSPTLNPVQQSRRNGSEHKPVIRRDVEPVKHSNKAKHMNSKLVRSLSEMHLANKKYDKVDTDSDTGFRNCFINIVLCMKYGLHVN